jgi:tetratricopeptide (TPR) repeat protein/DNA-binding XRE family transcriptional regulator
MDSEPVFGRWLRRRRRTMDLTQKQLARRAHCSPATIRKIEADLRRPSRPLAERLARALDIQEVSRPAFVAFARRGWSGSDLPGPGEAGAASPVASPGTSLAASPGTSLAASPAAPLAAWQAATDDDAVFVGRERELARLDRHLADTLTGAGGIVFVTGEPGSGKSALLGQFAARAATRHPEVVFALGRCDAYGGIGDPFLPFRDLLAGLCGLGPRTGPDAVGDRRRAEVARLVRGVVREHGAELLEAFLPAAAAGPAAPVPLPERSPQRLFDQYARVLSIVAARHPSVLMVDDLQWADGASLDLLFYLVRRLVGARVLIVGACRAIEASDFRAGAGRDGPTLASVVLEIGRRFGDVRIDLDAIRPDEARRFVDELLDVEPNTFGDSFRSTLYGRTEGHPLFVVELLRAMRHRGDTRRDARGRWCEGASLDWSVLPARVEAVVAERVERLADAPRAVLRVASVVGEVFSAAVVARVLGADELELLRLLTHELGGRQGLVRELEVDERLPVGGARFRFSHALFRQYLYDGLGAGERRALHARVARATIDLHQADLEAVAVHLAHHFGQAGELEQAAAYSARAGVRAQRLAALDEAVGHYRAALASWPRDDPHGRARVLRWISECLLMSGSTLEALRASEEAKAGLRGLGERVAVGALDLQIGRLYWERGDRARSLAHYHGALATLEEGPPSPELARALASLAQMHMLASDYDEAIAWGSRAVTLAEQLGAVEVAAHARGTLGIARATLGEHEAGLALSRQSVEGAVALGQVHDAGRAYNNLAELLDGLCRYDELRRVGAEMLAFAERRQLALFIDTARVRSSGLDWSTGRWSPVLAAWPVQEPVAEDLDGFRRVLTATFLATVRNDLGLTARASTDLEATVGAAHAMDEIQMIVPHAAQLLRARAAAGAAAGARVAADEIRRRIERARYVDICNAVLPVLVACRWYAAEGSSEDASACLALLARADTQLATPLSSAAWLEAKAVLSWLHEPAGVAPLVAAARAWAALARPLDEWRVLGDLLGAPERGRAAEREVWRARQRTIIGRLARQIDDADLRRTFLDGHDGSGARHEATPASPRRGAV